MGRHSIDNCAKTLCVCAITENVVAHGEDEEGAETHEYKNEIRLEKYFGEFEEEI
ncbi:hypothetical protein [Acetobacter fabarum]|uniref:hypothetical protein n=1 Tax=Acetobacter fabarum TaxID=483199 RepID=UPI0039EC50B4